jgi:GntR family transcriptional repressor for pyruvate dehydrogenase complex
MIDALAADQQVESPLVEAVLRPVRGLMAFESCVEQLGSAVRMGIFRAGDRLPSERDLAERLNVSRATVREAISALRAAGLVSTSRGRGGGTKANDVVVEFPRGVTVSAAASAKWARKDIEDVIVYRSVIEPGAAYQAAQSDLDGADRMLLGDCLADVEGSTDPSEYRKADARLHLAIAAVCGSNELTAGCNLVQVKIHEFLAEIPFLLRNIERSNAQHATIVTAILEHDGDKARDVMTEHCAGTAALLKGLLM